MINSKISFHGDSTAIIKFGDEIDEDLNILVHKFLECLVKGFSENSSVLDIYPTYNSIIIDYFDLFFSLIKVIDLCSVSNTHLTMPTNIEV